MTSYLEYLKNREAELYALMQISNKNCKEKVNRSPVYLEYVNELYDVQRKIEKEQDYKRF